MVGDIAMDAKVHIVGILFRKVRTLLSFKKLGCCRKLILFEMFNLRDGTVISKMYRTFYVCS
jgi:hypothetical protein